MSSAHAQASHFIYVQSDNHQPFYVKINNEVYSSNEEGFVILSKLPPGELNFTVGFPKNIFPASSYQLDIVDRDLGYQLKKMTETNWALYDLNSGELLNAAATIQPATYEIVKSNDEFVNKLADASHTPSIKEIKVLKDSGSVVVSTPAEGSKKKEKNKRRQEQLNDEVKKDSMPQDVVVATPAEPAMSVEKITKTIDRKDNTGYYLEFDITTDGIADHVKIFIPEPIIEEKKEIVPQQTATMELANDAIKTTDTAQAQTKEPELERKQVLTKCTSNATEQDFLQLRRKLVEQEKETSMLEVAFAAFNERCFTTMQVKNLAVLFLSESSRYEFLQMVYPNVIDNQNYSSLTSLFEDAANQAKFKAILH